MHPEPETPILMAEGLSFSHSQPSAPPLFDQLSLVLAPGVTWVCGDEGTGKTTLLQLLAGKLPSTGQLRIQGVCLTQEREAYQRQVAWFDPRATALDQQTARQIFAGLPQRHPGCDLDALQAHIDGLSLAPHLDKALFMLSTGSRRKVFLAAALAARAPVTLLDQPFMALDRPSIDYLLAVLAEAARQPGRAWVVADYEAPGQVALAAVVKLGEPGPISVPN
ncbi:ABC transporter ATP-binding protein [Polaromonas naphthalenivorans]|uniref:ABC transporter related protein n=1 Tax=Polaromonas naphthalenivorans (strain CJ2) TaxID=365044 RepID=A1VIF4_POLNA|nr:ATP-binding cassette domain-containing protein [Polaromonas naphthalenivorans]ABM35432.1 ABC transporter related protein [Polaromonas naphthalenivorans CJ2]